MMKKAVLIVILCCVGISCSKDQTFSGDPVSFAKPNILLIIADDMGLDATPGYSVGSVKPNTPTLQSLVNGGLRFNNVWSNPTCTPTRASILTGTYGVRTGVTKVGDELATSETSLQQYLRNNNTGYSTAVIGKWHLSNNVNHPNAMGVGYYAGLLNGAAPAYDNWSLTQNGFTTTSSTYITSKFSDLAIDWLNEQTDPWFLWLAYTAPHTPFHLPPSELHSQGNLPTDQASIDANPQPYYMAMIEAMDTEIGRVLGSLSPSAFENTIIIFIGDNGTPSQVVQEYPAQRAKGTLYQGGINVPMIIAGKGVSRTNQVENALINTSDLFATIASIAGIAIDSRNDSMNFKPLLTNGSISTIRDYVYAELGTPSGGADYTIRNQTHKYIKFDDGSEALFDLSANPFESPNLLHPSQLPLNTADEAMKNQLSARATLIRQ